MGGVFGGAAEPGVDDEQGEAGLLGRRHSLEPGELARAADCRLLESRRDVHGVAGRERASLARPSDHDLARVHPDPQREAVREELVQTLEHPERRLQRPLGVVLLGHRGAEDRDDRVADELLDRPAAERDLGFHRVVEALEEVSRVLGIELGTHRRRADEIGEQERRQLPLHRSRIALRYGPSRDGSAF